MKLHSTSPSGKIPMLPPSFRQSYTYRYISCWSTYGSLLYSSPLIPSDLSSASFSLIWAVLFPLSPPNSLLMRSSVSDITSLTSATAELMPLGSIICIRGSKSDKNVVPSPKTTQGSSSDSRIRPVPALAASAARSTGTGHPSLDICNELVLVQHTTVHHSGEKSNPFPSHAGSRSQE